MVALSKAGHSLDEKLFTYTLGQPVKYFPFEEIPDNTQRRCGNPTYSWAINGTD